MPYNDNTLKKAASILYQVVTDPQVKLAFGARKRAEIKAAVDKGETPTCYRTEWLRNSRTQVAKLLQRLAVEFNDSYPHDACSVTDLLDVLSSTHHQFQQVVKKKEAQKK